MSWEISGNPISFLPFKDSNNSGFSRRRIISAQQEKERKAMSLLRPGPLDVTAGSTFSFDELLGLVVDSMQIYGNEITKLRRANEDFKYVTLIVSTNQR